MNSAPERTQANLREVRERIAQAARRSGRGPDAVRLVAVTKTVPTETIRVLAGAGQADIGENQAQQLRDRARELAGLAVRWHMIGHLQRNKVKYVVAACAMIHSVDSLRLAEEISKRAQAAALPGVDLVGLMTMAPIADEAEKARPVFVTLRECLARVNCEADLARPLTELSMGMTQDYEVAIEEGATIVRVGTALFR